MAPHEDIQRLKDAVDETSVCTDDMHTRRNIDQLIPLLARVVVQTHVDLHSHMKEETGKIEEIHQILVGAKITLKVIKWITITVSGVAAGWLFLKNNFHITMK